MLTIVYQSRFKKDAKRYTNNKKAQKAILTTISLLQTGKALPKKYKGHPLIGNYTLNNSSCRKATSEIIPMSLHQ